MKLSAVILSKNEEDNLERSLKSLDFCDEIILIDDFSTDKTVDIARKHKAKVFQHHLDTNFANQRNFGAEKALGDWLLYIDADEVVSEELMKEVMIAVMRNDSQFQAYYIRRRDHYLEKSLSQGEVAEVYAKGLVRLMKKDVGTWQRDVHEAFVTVKPIGQLSHFIDHYPHPSLAHFIRKINYYSSIRAGELYKKHQKTNIFDIIFTPFFKFIYTYFFRQGFMDGPEGFIYSFFMSFHSFLVRAKLHLKWYTHET